MDVLPIDKERVFGIETEYGLDHAAASTSEQFRNEQLNKCLPSYLHPIGGENFSEYGGRIYADQFKNVEVATPELTTIEGLLASHFAGESLARVAILRLGIDPETGKQTKRAIKRSLDSRKNSRGEHQNFLVGNEFNTDDMLQLLPHLASRIVLTGCGGVIKGGRNDWSFVLDQRALVTKQPIAGGSTTTDKPFMKTLSNDSPAMQYKRLQIVSPSQSMFAYPIAAGIFNTSSVIRLVEHGLYPRNLVYNDPCQALHTYAHDPSMTSKAELQNGQLYTAAEMQAELLDTVLKYDDMPEQEITMAKLSREILADLMDGRREERADHVEWVAKYMYYRRQAERAERSFPNVKTAQTDIQWHELSSRSLAIKLRKAGRVAMMPDVGSIIAAKHFPPDPTRAVIRANLAIEVAETGKNVHSMDWHSWMEDPTKPNSRVFHDPWGDSVVDPSPKTTVAIKDAA